MPLAPDLRMRRRRAAGRPLPLAAGPNGRAMAHLAGAAAITVAAGLIAVGWYGYHEPPWGFALAETVGLSFIVAGWAARARRPDNRMGLLMMAAGVSWYLTNLQFTGIAGLYAAGYWLTYLDLVVFAHVALAYPLGRVTGPLQRWLLVAAYGSYLVLQGGRYLDEGQVSPIGWHPSPLSRWADLLSVNALVFGIGFILVIAWRWMRASTAERRLHRPVWSAMLVTNAVLGGSVLASLAHRGDIGQLFSLAYGIGLVTLPFVYLGGVLRAHRRITDLILALEHAVSPTRLRDLLAEALGDPALVVGFWSGEGTTGTGEYTGIDGSLVVLPGRPDPRTVTRVSDGEHHLAVLVHDPAVATRPALVRTVVAAARLALSNARLQALQRRQLEELHASRERIAVAALDERRRIERDLHDGVQQRLLRLSWLGQQALDLSGAGPAGTLLRDLVGELRETGTELRELARGIHPALITDQGLAVAVEEYAVRGPLAVTVDLPPGRYPDVVEVTAFFVIMEAVVNAARHAGVDRVAVRGHEEPGRLVVEVCDRGTGGADPAGGTGLRNMADRLAALDGSLSVTSPPGGGTRVMAVLPCV